MGAAKNSREESDRGGDRRLGGGEGVRQTPADTLGTREDTCNLAWLWIPTMRNITSRR